MIATTTLLILINSVRNQKLTSDQFLINIAQTRCENMQEFSHKDYLDFYSKQIEKKYHYTGENLALGFANAEEAFKALENSPTHKDNNHNKNYQRIGIATCQKPAGTQKIGLTVILFGGNKTNKK